MVIVAVVHVVSGWGREKSMCFLALSECLCDVVCVCCLCVCLYASASLCLCVFCDFVYACVHLLLKSQRVPPSCSTKLKQDEIVLVLNSHWSRADILIAACLSGHGPILSWQARVLRRQRRRQGNDAWKIHQALGTCAGPALESRRSLD